MQQIIDYIVTYALQICDELRDSWQLFLYNPHEPMMFTTGIFMFLFAAFYVIYGCLKRTDTLRLIFVTLFSYYFYYKSSGLYFVLLAVVTLTDFTVARRMAAAPTQSARRWLMAISVTVNLGLLAFFKYTNFFAQIIADMRGLHFDAFDIFLPVGISFFTFQSLSYTIDVYRRRIEPLNRLLDYAFYVSFFPQLVAGPIVRARDFIPQIRQPLFVTRSMLGTGVMYIVSGAIKKIVISDYISINFVERIFDNPSLYSGFENLMGVYGYALQIYCDFSGYSDMAIGLALLLGFRFNINFNSPYKATSITDFWRRWYISLSSWLKDYLYISLGGNRKGRVRRYINLIITMLLGGLWHGASLNFVLWGLLHGVALALHKMWLAITRQNKDSRVTNPILRAVCIVITFHFVCFCWIFFRNTDFANSMAMISQIIHQFHPEVAMQWVVGYWQVLVMMAVGYVLHFVPASVKSDIRRQMARLPWWAYVVLLVAMAYLVIQFKSAEVQPFIYFQF